MSSSNTLSHLKTQWIDRFENHKKKIASEEKITEMKFGPTTTFYIQHTAESALPSSDKRRQTLHQYKNFIRLIEEIGKEEGIDHLQPLIERAKAEPLTQPGKTSNHSSLNKVKQLLSDFQNELHKLHQTQKKSQPNNEIKR
jgi:hypothetical protein